MKHKYNLSSFTCKIVTSAFNKLSSKGLYVMLAILLSGLLAKNAGAQSSITIILDQPISCHGFNDGAIQATSTLTGGSLTFDIDGQNIFSNTTGFFDGLMPGTHTVCVTDGLTTDCGTIVLVDPPALDIIFNIDSAVGCAGQLGGLSANITGGTLVNLPGYLTEWRNSSNVLLNPDGGNNENYQDFVTGLPAGTYTLRVEDEASCILTMSVDLPELCIQLDQQISCHGASNGSIQATSTMSGSLTYDIDGANTYSNTTGFFNGLAPGIHTVCVTNGTNTACGTITLIDPPALAFTFNIDSVAGCAGQMGGLSANITGGTLILLASPLTEWRNSSNVLLNPDLGNNENYHNYVTGIPGGTYTLRVEDELFCNLTQSFVLPDLCLQEDQQISCFGAHDGTVQASTTTTGTWNFGIDGGPMTNPSGLFLNLGPGTHTVCMSDGSNSFCRTINLIEPAPLAATFTVNSTVSCLGNDGSLTINITGGTAGLGYLTVWTNSANDTLNDQTLYNYATTWTGLEVGSYTVHVEDDHACVADFSTTLAATPPVVVTASAPAISCFGGTTLVTPVASGGTGAKTTTISGTGSWTVGAGTYTVTATDTKGCTATTVITITQPDVLAVIVTADSLAGCTASDYGGLGASISGGTGPYTTEWRNSSNTLLNGPLPSSLTHIGQLPSDTYSLLVTDANGCTATVSSYMPTLCLFHDQEISCYGANDGTIQASTTMSGTPMFGIDGGLLNNPSGLFIGLTPGIHTICVSNDLGVHTYCDTVQMLEPAPLSATFTVNSTVSCLGNDGSLTINIAGGTFGVGYLTVWTNTAGDTLNDQLLNNYATTLFGLSVGAYTVHVEDDHACVADFNTTLAATPAVTVSASAPAITCFGGTTTVTPVSSGGTGALVNTISGGSWTVGAGSYTVTATDTKGCTATTVISISQPAAIVVVVTADSLAGCTASDYGGLSASISGGTGPYTTEWRNSSNTLLNGPLPSSLTQIGQLPSDTYSLLVTDANGCTATVSSYMPTLCLFHDQEISCYGANDGTIQASTTMSGTPMFGIDGGLLNNPSGLFIGLTPGIHTICVSNDLGVHTYCDTVQMLEPAPLSATFTVNSTVSCLGNDGSLTINIAGGTFGVGYLTVWTNTAGDTLNDQLLNNYATTLFGLSVGAYTVHVEDDHACVADFNTTLAATPAVTVSASAPAITCFGGTTTVTPVSSGGTGALVNTISGGSWIVSAGSYTVTATDTKGCTATTVLVINQPSDLTVTITIDSLAGCLPTDFGGLAAAISGGTGPYTTEWRNSANTLLNGPLPSSLTSLGNLSPDTYSLLVTDANGCTKSASFFLPNLCLAVDQVISCFGANDGTIQASTTMSGTPLFGIDGGAMNNPSGLFLGITPGTHTICVSNDLGVHTYCDTIFMDEPTPLSATFTTNATVSCLGNDGSLTININGGTMGIGYLTVWTNAAGDTLNDQLLNNYATTLTGLGAGIINVHVEDEHACVADYSTTLALTPPLVVTASASPILCFGGSTTINATSTDGYQPATFAIGTTPLPASFPAGTYTVTGTDTKGCTGTTVITLTQPPFLPIVQTATACDSYTWAVNNQTYTTSGTYIATFTSVNGCDSSYSLNLTVNYSSATGDATATACDSYLWNGTTYTTSGTYTYTTLNASGCTNTATLYLTINYSTTNGNATVTACDSYLWNGTTYTTSGVYTFTSLNAQSCLNTATLNLTVNYQTSSVETITSANSYKWLANGVTYTASGTYTHTLVGGNSLGCDSNLTLHLTILNINVMIDQELSCNNSNDASALATGSGGSGNFTYDIDGANLFTNTTGSFINLTPGTHTICAKESPSNVVVCGTVTFVQPAPISGYFVVDSTVSCLGNDGQLSVVLSGGVTVAQPFLTIWTNSTPDTLNDQNTDYYATTVGNLPVGNYFVRAEDDRGCYIIIDTTLGLTPPVVVNASATTIICYGGMSTVSASSTGGLAPVTYTIGTTTLPASFPAGTYTVTGTDVKGCTGTTIITITQPAQLAYSSSASACDSYTWAQNNQTYTTSGVYTKSYTSVDGCDSVYTLNLTIQYSSASVTNVTVANTYTWNANGVTYTNSGTYTHTITGGNAVGCDSNLTLNLNILNINVQVDQNVSCNGNNDGSIISTATGGTGNFTYDIDGANVYTNTTGTFLGLAPGSHTICAKESPSNVVVCSSVTITEPAPLSIVLTVDSTVSCLGNDGGVSAVISGGTTLIQSYLTTWSGGTNTGGLYDTYVTGLTPGVYTLTVEDDNLCFATASVNVGLTAPVTVAGSYSPILCNGASTLITPVTSGGTGTITTTISGGSYNVTAGTYTITATDSKGCTGTTEVTITEPALLYFTETESVCNTYTWAVNNQTYTTSGTYIATYLSVNGCDSTHVLNLTVRYSTSSVTDVTVANSYTWNANGVTYTASGTYTHTFVGGNAAGCDSSLTLNLNILNITVQIDQNVSCNGNNDGSVISSATGGSGNFTYDIDGANLFTNTTGTFLGLTPGTHTICAKESPSNVSVCSSVTITEPDPISIVLTVDSLASCYGNDGGISAVITGGTTLIQPYLTTWASGVTTNSIYQTSLTGLTPGTYTLTVEDDNLCFASATITVGSAAPLNVTASATTILCNGGTSVITPSTTGGTGVVTTSITGGSYTVGAGTYVITATDSKGCTATTSITITEPALLAYSQSEVACDTYLWTVNNQTYTTSGTYIASYTSVDGCDSIYTLNLVVNYSSSSVTNVTADGYTWPVNGVSYTASGTYYYTIPGGNSVGCDSNLTLNFNLITISVVVDQNVSCNGNNDGSANATAAGGTGNFTYDIDGGSAFTNTTGIFLGLTPGTHTICAKESPSNALVCGTFTITEPAALSVVLTVDSTVSCHGNDGGISAVVTGGTTLIQPYLTTWSGGATTLTPYDLSVTGLTAGTYTLTVEDDNSCFASASITVGTTTPVSVSATNTPIACYGGTSVISYNAAGGTGALSTSISGGTYTVGAGTYTITTTDTKGCTATTEVVVTEPAQIGSSQTISTCDSYTWTAGTGTTYTTSGVYTMNIVGGASNGCDSLLTLNLTINYTNVHPSTFVNTCNTYTWGVNNVTYTTSGVYVASYTNAGGCDSSYTLNLVIRYSSSSVTTVTSTTSYTWNANSVTYTASGVYTATLTNAAGCDSLLTLNLTIAGITIAPKVFLAGPYVVADGLMMDSLRSQGLIPNVEPYTLSPYNKPTILDNVAAEKVVSNAVLSVTGSDAIVDWVFVELRSDVTPSTIVATKRALVQRDGDVVSSVDGVSPLYFAQNTAGNYYVSIKHRNHLGVMTAAALPLSATSTSVDFTTLAPVYNHIALPPISNTPRKTVGSVSLLWAGDANSNKNVKYNGLANDKQEILNAVGVGTQNNTLYGYRLEDVNMDGMVRYNNADNDKNYILNNTTGVSTPNAVVSQHTPN